MKVTFTDRARISIRNLLSSVGRMEGKEIRKSIADAALLISQNPQLGPNERLLTKRRFNYRSHVVHRHCKLVNFVDKSTEIIVIADVWDTRRCPQILMIGME